MKKWYKFEFDGYYTNKMSRSEGLGDNKFLDYVIRPSKNRFGCHCGNHSMGKEIFFYEKNRRLYGIRLLRRAKNRKKDIQ